MTDADCLSGAATWKSMVSYIQHSASSVFTIYDDEDSSNQIFKFTYTGTVSKIFGGDDTGDDLQIFANDIDTCPNILMQGDSNVTVSITEAAEFTVSSCTDEEWLKVNKTGVYFKGDIVCLTPCGGECPTKADLPFTLYNDCATVDEVGFLFSISGAVSTMTGSDDTGDDLILKANSNDSTPSIHLLGNAEIELHVANDEEIIFYENSSQFFKFDHSSDDSFLYGGSTTSDDLYLYANSIDSYAAIILEGNGNAIIDVATDKYIYFKVAGNTAFSMTKNVSNCNLTSGCDIFNIKSAQTRPSIQLYGNQDLTIDLHTDKKLIIQEMGGTILTIEDDATGINIEAPSDNINLNSNDIIYFRDNDEQMFKFDLSNPTSFMYGSDDTGDALRILANSTDSYPYISLEGDDYIELRTTNDIYFYEQAEQMFKFGHSTPTSKIYGSDDTGDDLQLLANTVDSCAAISIFGNGGVKNLVKLESTFEISTCSNETLFEVVSTVADKHVDFHCLDAHNFCLENRTSDPSSPTCTGQMWLRTDLV